MRKAVEVEKSTRTLIKMLDTYVVHLKVQGRRSYADADRLFKSHLVEAWPDLGKFPAADVCEWLSGSAVFWP